MELERGIEDLLRPEQKVWIETDVLPGYLKARRWFASKNKEILSVELGPSGLVHFGSAELLFGEINVQFAGGSDRYLLPLGLWHAGQENPILAEQLKLANIRNSGISCCITDAFSIDALPHGLLTAIKNQRVFKVNDAEIRCRAMPGYREALESCGDDIRHLSAEQSNSSLVIGGALIMKLIRRVMPGINPEVEMVRYLTENSYENVPALLGEVEHVDRHGAAYSMFVVQKFVENEGDGWSHTLEYLAKRHVAPNGYRNFSIAIGTRLAELHDVLAQPTSIATFSPRFADDNDVEAWVTDANAQLNLAMRVLQDYKPLNETERQDRDFALANIQDILVALPFLGRAGFGSLLTRIHGDFHLGQVLVANDDAYIIDFEGEPSKPLEVRRAKSSPLRDVAGLLRSLQYAAASSYGSHDEFVEEMSVLFLSAYREVHRVASRLWLNDERQESLLLDLFLLEKCAYEICYEAANRPTWIPIPLHGLAVIFRRVLLHLPEMKGV